MSSIPESRSGSRASIRQVFVIFLRLGLTSFGGPIAHLGYFRRELVERRQWLGEAQFSQLLAICQFLPGPASSQMGFSLGLLHAGGWGGLAAFIGFTLPSALLMMLFATLLPLAAGASGSEVIQGLKLVACAVVADAVLSMSKKLCPDRVRATLALLSAVAILGVGGPGIQLLVVAAGAVAGMLFCRTLPESGVPLPVNYSRRTGGLLLALFLLLLLGLSALAHGGPDLLNVLQSFYQAGALVFGGGHVVLPVLQDLVVTPGWVSYEQFLSGYGAAQAIPGPMFSFSAYLGMLLADGPLAVLMALTALLGIFLPGFLLVAGILPFWAAGARGQLAARAIAGINAAVVGLLGAALYDPLFTSGISGHRDLAIVLVAFALLAVWRLPSLLVVLWCVLATLCFG